MLGILQKLIVFTNVQLNIFVSFPQVAIICIT